jgi:hypothetical protein
MNRLWVRRFPSVFAAAATAVFFLTSPGVTRAQTKPAAPDVASDSVLRSLQAELTRSKAQLKMDNVDAPFYIEYRVFDVEQFQASAAFGALRDQNHSRLRLLRAVCSATTRPIATTIAARALAMCFRSTMMN